MRTTFLVLFLTICTLGIHGCANTFDGLGRDMQSAGEWMQDTVD
ncbi:MAG: entericidin EcnAB [Alphaproteobacteria bacterium]|nr:entericidin EcnAB [Alphaproteobacteria bacterium]